VFVSLCVCVFVHVRVRCSYACKCVREHVCIYPPSSIHSCTQAGGPDSKWPRMPIAHHVYIQIHIDTIHIYTQHMYTQNMQMHICTNVIHEHSIEMH